MGLRKSSPPPFEIMSRTWNDTVEQAAEVDLTDRHRRPLSIAAPDEDETEPAIEIEVEPPPTEQTEPSAPDRWGKIGWRDWLRDVLDRAPLVLRIPRGYVLIGVALLAGFIGFVYWIGHDRGTRTDPPAAPAQPADANLAALSNVLPGRQNPTHPGAPVGDANQGNPTQNGRASTVDTGSEPGQSGSAAAQPRPKMVRGTADPREADKRYFVLAAYSVNKEEYMTPLLEYLWSQGVEAGAFNSHNSGLYEVIALQGFAKADLDSKARRDYESLLRRIGKKWKQQATGNNDLGGMYPRRFDGTPARKSITKAN